MIQNNNTPCFTNACVDIGLSRCDITPDVMNWSIYFTGLSFNKVKPSWLKCVNTFQSEW